MDITIVLTGDDLAKETDLFHDLGRRRLAAGCNGLRTDVQALVAPLRGRGLSKTVRIRRPQTN